MKFSAKVITSVALTPTGVPSVSVSVAVSAVDAKVSIVIALLVAVMLTASFTIAFAHDLRRVSEARTVTVFVLQLLFVSFVSGIVPAPGSTWQVPPFFGLSNVPAAVGVTVTGMVMVPRWQVRMHRWQYRSW